MGGSTIKLQWCCNYVAAQGVPDPTRQAGGFGFFLALQLASNVMNDITTERFNWKWNRAFAKPFLTNSYQQDYPQLGNTDMGWLETAAVVDINSTSLPKPLGTARVVRDLPRLGQYIGSGPGGVYNQTLSWDYNKNLQFGVWPGAGVVYSPLIAAQVVQNPIMSMIDVNGNLLIVTTAGTTGSVAPELAANSLEGATVTDGSVVWTVVGPNSVGFRVGPLPGPTGPVYQFSPVYQMKAVRFTQATGGMEQTLDPIPDDSATTFLRGFQYQCQGASADPADKKIFAEGYGPWLEELAKLRKQGDREADVYGMQPATSPVESTWGWMRNPEDPSQPH